MEDKNDQEYYLRREAVARDMAERAADPAIKTIHSQMADAYAGKVGETAPLHPASRKTDHDSMNLSPVAGRSLD